MYFRWLSAIERGALGEIMSKLWDVSFASDGVEVSQVVEAETLEEATSLATPGFVMIREHVDAKKISKELQLQESAVTKLISLGFTEEEATALIGYESTAG